MDLVKSQLNISFAEATRPWIDLRAWLRAASNDNKAEIQAAPFVVDREKDKMRLTVQVKALLFEHDATGSPRAAIKTAENIMSRMHTATAFPDIRAMRYDLAFIEEVPSPFHELVESMRARYLQPSLLTNESSDIALMFEQHDDPVRKYLQLGPMDKAQLQARVLRWPNDALPETFGFLNIGYESLIPREFSKDSIHRFLAEALEWQTNRAQGIFNEFKKGLTSWRD